MNTEAIKELLYKMADDLLIIGHRNSEWTGLGPILEEDISFSSMAQDKINQHVEEFCKQYAHQALIMAQSHAKSAINQHLTQEGQGFFKHAG